MADPFEVAREWGGILRPIQFTAPKPLLPASTVTFVHYAGVPKRFEVTTCQKVRFDFFTTAENLTRVWEREVPDYSCPVAWTGLWQIGNITYTQASAWLCVEELSGRIVAVDLDDNRVYPVNGSVATMVRCMKLVSDWARAAGGSLARAGNFEESLSRVATLSRDEANYYWQPLIAEAIESGCDDFVVEFE